MAPAHLATEVIRPKWGLGVGGGWGGVGGAAFLEYLERKPAVLLFSARPIIYSFPVLVLSLLNAAGNNYLFLRVLMLSLLKTAGK